MSKKTRLLILYARKAKLESTGPENYHLLAKVNRQIRALEAA